MRTKTAPWWILALLVASTADAYQLLEYINPRNELVFLKWASDSLPVPYYVYQGNPPGFTLQQAVETVQASFNTWESIPTASITFQYKGTTAAEPFVFFDFINTLGFVTDPELEDSGILGATNWIYYTASGEIAEADIFFNSFYSWSVAASGRAGSFDFQSVATHEIGHFLGLGHSLSGVMETVSAGRRRLVEGSAIMYPFSFPTGSTLGRTPVADDIIGVSTLYPDGGFGVATGSIAGTVTKNGQGVLGAYVQAFNPFTGELTGYFTDEDGDYRIRGLKAGPHVVRVNPITDPASPEDFGFPEEEVDMDFGDAFFEGRAEVMSGGPTSGIDFEVRR